jgi:hypothetical protein
MEIPDLSPQLAGLFCDGIESVQRNWLAEHGMPEDYMPSWKDITNENPRLPYDEDAPKTIEELFASLEVAAGKVRPGNRRVRRRRRR